MSNVPEEFENLQKLLKIKQYEQPPPGFFNNFSTKVLSRIEAEQENAGHAWARSSWFRKFMMLLETNPVAAGAFGLSVCGLLVSGIAYSEYSPASFATNGKFSLDVADAGVTATPTAWSKGTTVLSATPSINPVFSTNVPGALFGFDQLPVQKVNFTLGQ